MNFVKEGKDVFSHNNATNVKARKNIPPNKVLYCKRETDIGSKLCIFIT